MKPNYLTVLLLLFSFISLSLISNVSATLPSITVSVSPGVNFQAGTNSTTSCARVVGNASSILTLYRDGLPIVSGTSSPQYETTNLPVGLYNYTCHISATPDYEQRSSSQWVTSIGYTPSIALSASPSFTFTYGQSSTVCCARIAGDPNSMLTLFREGTGIGSYAVATGTSSPQCETTLLDADYYNYTCYVGAYGSWSNKSSKVVVQVDKKTPSIAISASPGVTICENTNVTVSCARIDGNFTSTLTLYRDGIVVASGTSSPQSITEYLDLIGIYNYNCSIDSSVNWYGRSTSLIISNSSDIHSTLNLNTTFMDNIGVWNGDPESEFLQPNYLVYGHDTAGAIRSYIKFNLSTWSANSITTATLRLYQSGYLEVPANTLVVYEVLDDGVSDGWKQEAINWNNQPCGSGQGSFNASCNSTPSTDMKSLTAESYINISVTEFADRAFARGSKSFTLVITNLTQESLAGDKRNYFASSRNGSIYSPVLYLDYTPPSCISNIIIPQNITAGTFPAKFMNLMVSSQGAVLIIITFISAMVAKIFNEELSLYVTSALIFICGLLTFFPLWIGLTGSIFGAIVGIMIGKKGD